MNALVRSRTYISILILLLAPSLMTLSGCRGDKASSTTLEAPSDKDSGGNGAQDQDVIAVENPTEKGDPPGGGDVGTSSGADEDGQDSGPPGGGDGGNDGGNDGSAPGGEADAPSENAIDDGLEEARTLCAELAPVKKIQTVDFPNPNKQCAWEQDGNLAPINLFLQARREQFVALDLPENAVICDMAFDIPRQEMLFDDEIFLLFNNVYLTTSVDFYMANQPEVSGLKFYQWKTMVGQPYDRDSDRKAYCVCQYEGTGACSIPYSERTGPIDLSFDPDLVKKIAVASGLTVAKNEVNAAGASLTGCLELTGGKHPRCEIPKNEKQPDRSGHGFTFVTIGDNNTTDCQHKDFQFKVEIDFVVKP